jgi:DNA-binding CsgD family transcriptional regulator
LVKPVVCPVLIGRAGQLDLLDRLIDGARQGAGQTVLVAGEAGVGKSRLTAEVMRRAAERGWLVGQGACFEPDQALPFAPIIDLLRGLLASQSDDDLARGWASVAPDLLKLLPELADRLPGVTPAAAQEPEQEKRRLFDAVARLLADLTAARPALIVVEDLHWADATSLDLTLYLARRLAARPLLLLLTYRSDEIHPPLRRVLAGLDRERLAIELALERLSEPEIEAMLRSIFELDRPMRAEFVRAIYELTDGNPFFTEEVLRSLIAAGDISFADGTWDRKPMADLRVPRSVHDAVQQRVARLSPDGRQVLALAAVAGRRFDFALLQRLTGLDETALLERIKGLIAAQLVVEEAAGRFAFRHALTRQAVYADLLATERAALHRRVGQALEALGDQATEARAADLAYHYAAAGAWEPALTYARRAGDQALAMYSPTEAVEHYSRALDAAGRLGASPAPGIYRSRALAWDLLGDFEGARADHEAALGAARAAGDGAAEWQALLDLGFLWTGRDYARAGDYLRRALALARTLDDPIRLATSLNRVGNWRLNVEQPHEALPYHHEALAVFRRAGDRLGLAETLELLGMTSYLGGDTVQGTAYCRQAAELLRALDHRQLLTSCLATMTMGNSILVVGPAALVPAGPAGEATVAAEEALAIASAIGWRAAESFATAMLAGCCLAQGEYGRAVPLARGALAIAQEIEHRQWMTHGCWLLAMLHLDLLALPAARDFGEQGLALARAINSSFWRGLLSSALAWTFIEQQELARAAATLDEALALDEPPRTMAQRAVWCARAELALARGEPARALQIVDDLDATAANRGLDAIPRLAYQRGRALAALGEAAAAESALREAERAALTQGTPPLRWRALAALAALHQARRRRDDAEGASAEARAVVEALAVGVPDDDLRATFRQAAAARLPRPRPPTPLRAAKQASGGLTAREREVAALIAAGRTNREIAAALFASERTVATHVSNILGKLDLTSRTQIAAWAIARGLAAQS